MIAFRAGFPTPDWCGGTYGYYRIKAEGDRLTLIRQVYTI